MPILPVSPTCQGTTPVHYQRRRPEQTALYQLVQDHVVTFYAQVEAQTGHSLPPYVKAEFDAFLDCGILANGFLRLRCEDCHHEKLVAFSCKKRGFCPSCGARRMAETAAHLADNVIPRQPIRQLTPGMACIRATQEQLPRVISFPIPLRILLASQPQLLSPVLKVIHRTISGFLIKQAGFRADEAHTGAVTLIQRFGSAANLNIHLHCLFLDGVYRLIDGKTVFHPVSPPNTQQLHELLQCLIQRLMRCLVRRGVLVEDQGQLYLDESDSTDPSMTPLQASSCTYRIALGPRAGQHCSCASLRSQYKHIHVQKTPHSAND